jgi:hypothetical protein
MAALCPPCRALFDFTQMLPASRNTTSWRGRSTKMPQAPVCVGFLFNHRYENQ